MQKLKKIFSLGALLVFLFPLVEKEVHSFSHKEDFHCNVADKHFHQGEHHCNLCDFTNDISENPGILHHDLLLVELCNFNYFFSSTEIIIQSDIYRPLRAPPALV